MNSVGNNGRSRNGKCSEGNSVLKGAAACPDGLSLPVFAVSPQKHSAAGSGAGADNSPHHPRAVCTGRV